MSHPRLPEISQISVLPHHQADSQYCKILQISKISREWEHRDLEWKQDRELCKWKNFLIGQCRQVSPKPDADWKMSVAMKMKSIQDAKHGQFKVLNTNQQNSFSARRN